MIVKDSEHNDNRAIGNKARGLYTLKSLGYKVPSFIVVTAPFLNFETGISESEKDLVLSHLEAWDWKTSGVAVRSSFEGEDGTQDSFAGLFESVLEVQSEEALWKAVQSVVASVEHERVETYILEKGIKEKPRPAVIIQKQLQPDYSGVMFTQNPVYPREVAIHLVEGLGDKLVNGETTPVEFYLGVKTKAVLHKEIPEAYENSPFSNENNDVLLKIFDAGIELQQYFGKAVDVEFCVAGGELFLLQVRPITIAIPDPILYDNSNIQESYCGVTTPLTFSFAQRAYATVYRQTMKVLGLPKPIIDDHEEVVQNLLGLVKGRIYYNIQNWYKGLLLLPSFNKNKGDMERMMGLEEPVDFIDPLPKSFWEKLKMAPRLTSNLIRLLLAFKKLDRAVSDFQKNFEVYYKSFYDKETNNFSLEALWKLKEDLDDKLLYRWTTPIINDFFVMMSNGAALRGVKGSEAELSLKQQTLGQADLASVQPVIELQEIAQKAKAKDDLYHVLQTKPSKELTSIIPKDFPAFQKEIEIYISKYGDRSVGELKLETKTMRTHPEIFYNYLLNILDTKPVFKEGKIYTAKVSSKIRKLQKGIHNREALRLDRTKLFGMYRSVFLAIGAKLTKDWTLEEVEDIFFLEESEIKAVISGQRLEDHLISSRKRKNEAWENDRVPSRIWIPSRGSNKTQVEQSKDELAGQTCFAGTIEGEALVIKSPSDNLDVKGKIVCALRTDPGWATLFPSCKAVLIEKGSNLSHSAIILREMEIPSIINIQNLTEHVQSGDHLTVDAEKGIIKIDKK